MSCVVRPVFLGIPGPNPLPKGSGSSSRAFGRRRVCFPTPVPRTTRAAKQLGPTARRSLSSLCEAWRLLRENVFCVLPSRPKQVSRGSPSLAKIEDKEEEREKPISAIQAIPAREIVFLSSAVGWGASSIFLGMREPGFLSSFYCPSRSFPQ